MARTDFVDVRKSHLPADQAMNLRERQRAEKEAAEQARQETADNVAVGILGEAMGRGFAVNDDTREALTQQAPEPEPQEQATTEAPPDAVEAIIANLSAAPNVVEVEEEEDEPEVEMPDFEAEAERQLLDEEIARAESGYDETPEYQEQEESYSPHDRKRAIIAEKEAQFYKNLTANRERSKWEKEAGKHFPLSKHALDGIKAKSRRGFLKEAKQIHENMKPYVEALSAAEVEKYKALQVKVQEQERANAEKAWGKPTAGPGAAPTDYSGHDARMEQARQSGDLAQIIAAGMFNDEDGKED